MATETPSSKLDRGPALSPEVEDHVVVGSEKILDSPHVSEGPGRIANAPIPSIFVGKLCDSISALLFVNQALTY